MSKFTSPGETDYIMKLLLNTTELGREKGNIKGSDGE